MRIAVYHNLPSGGAKRALYEIARRLVERHELDVYTLSTAEHDFCDLRAFCDRYEIFPFQPLPQAWRPWGRLNQGIRTIDLLRLRGLQKQLAARIDAAGYDVLFAHHCRFSQAPTILHFLATPTVYYCQEPPRLVYEPSIERPYTELSAVQRGGNFFDPLPWLYRQALKRLDRESALAADCILVNSSYSRENLYRVYGVFARVCYLGVDTSQFRPLPVPKADFVLSVGQLNSRKGFDFLLSSLALIDRARYSKLIIVSNFIDSREQHYLEGLATLLRVPVSFQTLISDDTLVRFYNQARVTLYSPIMEPFGFVPIEAMACGTPVIAVREGGVRETVLDGETGFLVDRDVAAFAEATKELLTDPGQSAYMGRKGRALTQAKWNWQRSVSQIEDALASVQAAKSHGGQGLDPGSSW